MSKFYTNTSPVINVYRKASLKSEVVTQIIFGERFSILKKTSKWLNIRIKEDGYKGFIKKGKYHLDLIPTHKVSKLKANIYKSSNFKHKISELTFGSKIKTLEKNGNFVKFNKGWINQEDIRNINYKEKDCFRKIKIFKNIRYKWGGKSFRGIDCSALIQVFLNFNNIYCPRDAKDQVKYFKKNIKLRNIRKNDIIYWKGHVALAISKKKLIHAYGPMKKTVIMGINQTIKKIEKTAKLKVIGIKRL